MADDVRLDTRRLDALLRETPGGTSKVLRKLMFDMQADMANSMSAESPSLPGNPPGVDTGTLKNSLAVQQTGPASFALTGMDYGVFLEFGVRANNLAPRPWIIPAVLRALDRLPREMRAMITRIR